MLGDDVTLGGVLPAYAGMIPVAHAGAPSGMGAPRVCGDDPAESARVRVFLVVLPAYAGMIRVRAAR